MIQDKNIKLRFIELAEHRKAAIVIAFIVALADVVIVYDLHLAGSWLTPTWLSWFKTTAFVLLFIGSLIAEMQEISLRVRLLLLAGVVILSSYQAATNVVVNYYGALIPSEAIEFFAGWLSPLQVKFWFSITDGLVRTTVVVIMWLVTGLVWRGVATSAVNDELAGLQAELEQALADTQYVRQELTRAQSEVEAARAAVQSVSTFAALTPQQQVVWIAQNRNGEGQPTNQYLAEEFNVHPATIGRWIKDGEK